MTRTAPMLLRMALVTTALVGLGACNALTRLSEVGDGPKVSPIVNPTQQAHYRPVSMPMPAPQAPHPSANSLWRPGARAFFKDQRASEIGDILTVAVRIDKEGADFSNSTTQGRDTSNGAALPAFLGLETKLGKVLPDAVDPSNLIDFSSDTATTGTGTLAREETVRTDVAAVITQILPNGNLVITGRQEIRVNYELREITVSGVIRPEDISSSNTISSEKIAEARISYGGRGTISDLQQPRYGQQVYDILFPF